LDVAIKERDDLSQVDSELAAFTGFFSQPSIARVLTNPAVPAPKKRAAVAEVVRQSGARPVVSKLLVLLAERDRLVLLPDLLGAFRDRLMTHQGVVRAEVTTATPLAADRAADIERSIAALTQRTVSLSTRVDPSVIGGLVARVGSTVYDASVATQLEKMRQRLTEGLT
jgi:F-type H+-transporting ATPase subunit delta